MSLTFPQAKWLRSASPEAIAKKILDGTLSMEELRVHAGTDRVYALLHPEVERIITNMPNPAENADYEDACRLYGTNPNGPETGRALESYINKWSNNASAAEHLDIITGYYESNKEFRDFERLERLAPAEIQKYESTRELPRHELADALKQYLQDWGDKAGVDPTHKDRCTAWNSRVQEILSTAIELEWMGLFGADGILKNFQSLKQFLNKYPGNATYSNLADNALWDWAMAQPDPLSAASIYDDFYHGMGRHSADVANMATLRQQWNDINHNDIFAVIGFLKANPSSPFRREAEQEIERLKLREINEIANKPAYNPLKFRHLYEDGILTREELTRDCPVSDEKFERLLNHERIIESELLPIPPANEHVASSVPQGTTDIVLFGLASSGKTCTLVGLLANERMGIDSSDWSGRYGLALASYGRACIAPQATAIEFVAAIKSYVYLDSAGRVKVPFNLIDMSGEVYRRKIVGVGDGAVDTSDISFADMGEGAPEILSNSNDKVFFIIVDPTVTGDKRTQQTAGVQALVDMFQRADNHDVMKRVRGIHFIVTKSDLLGDNAEHKARATVCNIINEAGRIRLVNYCKDAGINASADENRNGHPRVFCYSLGKFHPLNHFTYDSFRSSQIIDVITDYVCPETSGGYFTKLRTFLTNPLF